MPPSADFEQQVQSARRTWLVSGAAGFIGSNLAERLLHLGQRVVGFDNFVTGHRKNVEAIAQIAPDRFRFIEGDLRDLEACRSACVQIDVVLHQAALGSVPRSISDPLASHQANVDGTFNLLLAARDLGVKRFVFASSSSVYGDEPNLPKREDRIGRPLSPYALTKRVNELYARIFHDTYGLETIGLRYFNVFGRRQDPNGPYAAVIPKWTAALLRNEQCVLYGDGETSRDFCFVENVIQANLLAATVPSDSPAIGQVFNVAYGARTTLNQLFLMIRDRLAKRVPSVASATPFYMPFRPGDIRHSEADISRARELLGYRPTHSVEQGLDETMDWYVENARSLER